MKTHLIYLNILLVLFSACKANLSTGKEQNPEPAQAYTATAIDEPFANVFKPLDGRWKGTFIVYEDTLGQRPENVQVRDVSWEMMKKLPLKISLKISVEQIYTSTSPYYQTVRIADTYTEADGSLKVVQSEGVNKVENGKLLCIVNKPDEQVIHKGSIPTDSTIVWERSEKNPLKIEYFYEEVTPRTYSIIGWGYYGDVDPNLSPPMWFSAVYERQEEK